VVDPSPSWPAGTILAGLAAWFLPPALGPDRAGDQQVRRIGGIASWSEQLRATLAAAAGLEQAILATAPIAPAAVRDQVTARAARIHQGQRLPGALRAFAAGAADPAADLVTAALLLAAEQHARDLGQLLSSLADSARQHAAMRLRVAAARARVRTASRIPLRGDRAAWRGHRERLHPADARPGRPAYCGSSR
jgi:tight adherence protein B